MLESTLKRRLRPYRHWLYTHYPVVVGWLERRLTTRRFEGLPLTMLTGLLVLNGLLLSEIAENIIQTDFMVQVDQWFTRWLFGGRSTRASLFLYGMTWFGSRQATIGLTVLGSAILLWQQQRRKLFILWGLLAGVTVLVQLAKRGFVRARPLEVAYYHETGFSFPSGHSATAMTLYGLLAYWWIRRLTRPRDRWLVGTGAAILIGLVGFSRIYLGVHFLSDVLGGFLLGGCWVLVGIALTEWGDRSSPPL